MIELEVSRCPECNHFDLICNGDEHRCQCGYTERCGIHMVRDGWRSIRDAVLVRRNNRLS